VITECERTWTDEGGGSWVAFLLRVFFFPLGLLWFRQGSSEGTQYGKDKIYTLPLAVCRDCRKALRGQNAIKECLLTEPVYERLLEKFPDATVRVVT
jgi:hypothetical protein